MQTFIPFPSFTASARALDNRRLGKQRVECLQILRALNGETRGWQNHPATKMWRGHKGALALYGLIVCHEWRKRGFKDTCFEKIAAYQESPLSPWLNRLPDWITEDFCLSHQSNLKRKDPAHYGPLFPDVPDDLPYVWPTNQNQN
jgi:hypothetical protein